MQVKIYILDIHAASSGIPGNKDAVVFKVVESQMLMFNTAQKPIDDYIRDELEMARINKREKSRKLPIANSEKVLYDYSKD